MKIWLGKKNALPAQVSLDFKEHFGNYDLVFVIAASRITILLGEAQ